MVDKSFAVTLPDNLLATLGWNESETPVRIREALVMELLRLDRLSESEAADLLSLDRQALLDLMAAHRVSTISLSPDELRDEFTKPVKGLRRGDSSR